MLIVAAHSELDEDDNDDLADYVDYEVEIKDSACAVLGLSKASHEQLPITSLQQRMDGCGDPLSVVCSLFCLRYRPPRNALFRHHHHHQCNVNGWSLYDFVSAIGGQSANCLRSQIVILLTRTREI